jgi:hypothetical protein
MVFRFFPIFKEEWLLKLYQNNKKSTVLQLLSFLLCCIFFRFLFCGRSCHRYRAIWIYHIVFLKSNRGVLSMEKWHTSLSRPLLELTTHKETTRMTLVIWCKTNNWNTCTFDHFIRFPSSFSWRHQTFRFNILRMI